MPWCRFSTLYKILSLETIPLKSRVNVFLKRYVQEYIFQYRVFTKLSLIPFYSIFTAITVSKNHHPLLWSEGGNLQTDATQLFLCDPIPAKAKMLGLLSIYKFSLHNCQLKKQGSALIVYNCTLKGSQRMWGESLSLYRMSLISAGSISLDSTFNNSPFNSMTWIIS